MRPEFDIVLHVDVSRGSPRARGRVESDYGPGSFSGWLELLGVLERLIDQAHADAELRPLGERAHSTPPGRERR